MRPPPFVDSWGFALGLAAAVHLVAGLLPVRPEQDGPDEDAPDQDA